MFINKVLSSYGAWGRLEQNFSEHLQEIRDAIAQANMPQLEGTTSKGVDKKLQGQMKTHLRDTFRTYLTQQGWYPDLRLRLGDGKNTRFSIDFVKNRIGLDVVLGLQVYLLSNLFANFPLAIQSDNLEIGIIAVPMRALSQKMGADITHFEFTNQLLQALQPRSLKYPFVVMGFSEIDTGVGIVEQTTDLDQFLVDIVGITLGEMILIGERPSYDFKLSLPRNGVVAREVCGMANIKKGGVIILGVSDAGAVQGIPRGQELDSMQLSITNNIHTNCRPVPTFDFHIFDVPNNQNHAVLILQVHELGRKPCMTQDRVYVRSGPSARPADSEEIRRMILAD